MSKIVKFPAPNTSKSPNNEPEQLSFPFMEEMEHVLSQNCTEDDSELTVGKLQEIYEKLQREPNNVIDINAHRDHLSGEAICLVCRHTWIAVAPCGTIQLECPACGIEKGVFSRTAHCSPYLYCSACGCSHFSIDTNWSAYCLVCGVEHRQEDN